MGPYVMHTGKAKTNFPLQMVMTKKGILRQYQSFHPLEKVEALYLMLIQQV